MEQVDWLVTHTAPDLDAIGAAWLLQRFGGLGTAVVRFVSNNNPDPLILAGAKAVVDTGREFDTARLRFDHHQFAGALAGSISATMLVWEYLRTQDAERVEYLEPLVALINSGDTGSMDRGAHWSRIVGLHALVANARRRRLGDHGVLAFGYMLLDSIEQELRHQRDTRADLSLHTVYLSRDGLLIGLWNAGKGHSTAAFELGARVVVFGGEYDDTVSVGAWRGGSGPYVDLGALVGGILDAAERQAPDRLLDVDSAEYTELRRWFRHNAGFFAGRGTGTAPDLTPLTASFEALCAILDKGWTR